MSERILACVYAAVDDVNRDPNTERPLAKALETPIHGSADALDSLGLINFVVAVEEHVEREFDVMIVLGNDRALSDREDPFRSIGSLVEHLTRLLQEQGVAVAPRPTQT